MRRVNGRNPPQHGCSRRTGWSSSHASGSVPGTPGTAWSSTQPTPSTTDATDPRRQGQALPARQRMADETAPIRLPGSPAQTVFNAAMLSIPRPLSKRRRFALSRAINTHHPPAHLHWLSHGSSRPRPGPKQALPSAYALLCPPGNASACLYQYLGQCLHLGQLPCICQGFAEPGPSWLTSRCHQAGSH